MSSLDVLTGLVIGCCYRVSNALGIGFAEKVYENALVLELRKAKLTVRQQYPLKVFYEGAVVGEFYVDILVEDSLLVELKAVSALEPGHLAQALNYLRASGLPACLLVNFGTRKIQVRRLHPSPLWKET